MGHIACFWSHRYAPIMSDLRRDNYFYEYWGAQFQWPTKPCIIAAQLLLEVQEILFFLGLSDRVPQNWMVYDGLCLFSLLDMPKLEVYPNFRHTPIEREWALDVEGVDSVSPAVSSWFLGFPNHQMVEAVSCMKTARSSIIQWRVTTPFGCKSWWTSFCFPDKEISQKR